MKTTKAPLTLAALLILLPAVAHAHQAQSDARMEAVVDSLSGIIQELSRLEGISEEGSRRACRGMTSEIAALRGQVAALRAEVRSMIAAPVPEDPRTDRGKRTRAPRQRDRERAEPAPPPEPVVEGPAPISDEDLRRLMAGIEEESFSSGKLRVLDDAADYAWLTTSQVVRLLGLFTFSRDQLTALEMIARNILDPENAFEIYGAFTFESDKQKAREILRSAR